MRLAIIEGDQPPGDRRARDGGRGDPGGPAPARRILRRQPEPQAGTPTIPTAPRSCSPRRAIPTDSSSRCTAQRPLRQRREGGAGGGADADPHRHQDRRAGDAAVRLLHPRIKLEFSLMLLGWGADTGEPSSPLKSLLATNDPGQRHGHRQPRPLLQPEAGRAPAGGARDRRRRQARGPAAAGDRDRHRGCRHHPAALRGDGLGHAQRPRLRGQHEPVHPGLRYSSREEAGRAHPRGRLPSPLRGGARGSTR